MRRRIKKKGLVTLCTQTVYNYIDKGQMGRITNKILRIKSKPKKQKKNKVKRLSHKGAGNTSIEERPEEINSRETFGHWEMDSIKSGKTAKESLLVLIERLTRNIFVYGCKGTLVQETKRVLDSLEKQFGKKFKKVFKSITVDNGSEFLDQKLLEQSCRTKGKRTQFYYCHPYTSCERGSSENVNRMVRYYVPKGSNIGKFTAEFIAEIQEKINFMPRKIFAYVTANERFTEQLEILFS